MADTDDADRLEAQARVDKARPLIEGAWEKRAQDPYSLGEAVASLARDVQPRVLGFSTFGLVLEFEFPKMDSRVLLRSADLVDKYTRDEANHATWADIDLLDQVLRAEGLSRSGPLDDQQIRLLDAKGKWIWVRFADRKDGQLAAALAKLAEEEARKNKPRPAPSPGPHDHPPDGPPSPDTGPGPHAPAGPLPFTGKVFGAGLAVLVIGEALSNFRVGFLIQLAGIGAMLWALWRAGTNDVPAWASWARAWGGIKGLLLGGLLGLLGKYRIGALATLLCGVAWAGWHFLTFEKVPDESATVNRAEKPAHRAEPVKREAAQDDSAPRVTPEAQVRPVPEPAPSKDTTVTTPASPPTAEKEPIQLPPVDDSAGAPQQGPPAPVERPVPHQTSRPSPAVPAKATSEAASRKESVTPHKDSSAPRPTSTPAAPAPQQTSTPAPPPTPKPPTFKVDGEDVPLDAEHDLSPAALENQKKKSDRQQPRKWEP